MLMLVYKKAGGDFEYFYATVDTKEHVTFGPIHELSTIMMVQGTIPNEPMDVDEMDTRRAACLRCICGHQCLVVHRRSDCDHRSSRGDHHTAQKEKGSK